MRIYLLLVVAYILMASCNAKDQRNLGLFSAITTAVVKGVIRHKIIDKLKKNLQEVDNDVNNDLQVSILDKD